MSKVRTRKRGKTYSYSFEIGNDPKTGKRRMKEKGGYATAKEAYDAGVEAYADWQHGNIGIISKKITFEKFFELWYKNICSRVRKNTQVQYDSIYRCYLKPYLNQKYMQDISPLDIDNILHKLVEKGHARSTLLSTYRLAHHVFKYAIYPAKIIRTNPTEYINIPKTQKPEKGHKIISRELFEQILNRVETKPHIQMIFNLAYYTGMRIGEILGLTWDKISFEEKSILIDSQMLGNVKKAYIGLPKTNAGVRTIFLGNVILQKLKAWKIKQNEWKLKMGQAYQLAYMSTTDKTIKYLPSKANQPDGYAKLDLVCTNTQGMSISRYNLNMYLSEFECHVHDFRHTHATKLIEAGAAPVDVAARLGHSSTIITQDLYTHVTEKMQRQTADIADRVL